MNIKASDIRRERCKVNNALSFSEKSHKPLFVLEAKLGPNDWCSVGDVYPQVELSSYYCNHESARLAKSKLKTLLLGFYKGRYRKKPIRIREVCQTDQP
jgi:hypothetical protein